MVSWPAGSSTCTKAALRTTASSRGEDNTNSEGVGIGGGVGDGPEGYEGHITFYIEVPDVGAALDQAESLGGKKLMGPDSPMEGLTIGLFNDPEGHPSAWSRVSSPSIDALVGRVAPDFCR